MPPQLTGICTALPTQGLGAPQHLVFSWSKCSSAGLNPRRAFTCFLRDFVLLQLNRGGCEGHLHKQPSAARLVLTFPSCHVLLPGCLLLLHPSSQRIEAGERAPQECVLGDTERERLGRGCVGRAGRSREEEGRRPGSTEDQNKALPAPLDSHWISKKETGAEESGYRQPGVMNLWMSLLAKRRGSTEESGRTLWL